MRSLVLRELTIPLASLKPGVNSYTFFVKISEEETGFAEHFPEGFEVKCQVTPMGKDYFVELETFGNASLACDRCLEDFKRDLKGSVKTLFTPDRQKWEGSEGDVQLISPDATEIQLERDVIDALSLSIPNKTLCQKDCRGLCAGCGCNLNNDSCQCSGKPTDPRWDALKNLTFDK